MGGDEARAALRAAVGSDPFWAVRQAAIAGLDPEDAEDAEALRTTAAEDAKSDVRTSALGRLGGVAGLEFLIERFRNDSSYRAQAAAITALGEVGGDAASAVLEEAAAMASPRDIIGRAARKRWAGVSSRNSDALGWCRTEGTADLWPVAVKMQSLRGRQPAR